MRYLRVSSGQFRDDYPHSFTAADFTAFGAFLDSVGAVMPIRDGLDGRPGVLLRHDIDHNIDHAVAFAEWEASRGFHASFYVLHTSWYYADEAMLRRGMERLVELGHEVGFHQDAVAEAYRRGFKSPLDGSVLPIGDCAAAADIVYEELERLRGFGFDIVGSATHGTGLWATDHVTNSFLWGAGYRPEDFGLRYEAYFLHRFSPYISDNRGKWSSPFVDPGEGQLHILTHPCHWDVAQSKMAA